MKHFVFIILCIAFVKCNQNKETRKESAETQILHPDTLYSKVKFTQLKCGLYINEISDIAFRTFEVLHDSLKDRYLEMYITRVYSEELEVDGGPPFMKNVVDTSTFRTLNDYYFKDKSNIYFFTATSDGGNISILTEADHKTFKVNEQNSELAKDKDHFFLYGHLVDKNTSTKFHADSLTWK